MQPASLQPLNQSELAHITAAIEYARQKGMYIILDPHNFGKMWSGAANSYKPIGISTYIPNNYFADFWSRLSTVYKNYPNVLYGLMNEPNIQSPTQWKATALAAINAIRAVSTSQTILIPGTYFTNSGDLDKERKQRGLDGLSGSGRRPLYVRNAPISRPEL